MARITGIRFDSTNTKDGCTCDRCGQWIKNIWTVSFDDGLTAHFGIDCYEQMCKDSRLNEYGMRLMKKTLKSLQKWADKAKEEESLTEETDAEWKNTQAEWNKDNYWYGKPWEEYHTWMLAKWYPQRLKDAEKDLARFAKINFKRTLIGE